MASFFISDRFKNSTMVYSSVAAGAGSGGGGGTAKPSADCCAAFTDTKGYCPGVDCPREKGFNRPSSYAPLRCCYFNHWVQPEVCRMKTLSCLTRTL